ncbi:MAG TPA: hypothetical protein VLG50_06975 [Candidatus Saccharimonadales bacterium]|nr:hypothetical protein [Candidatus Saccharimonadales bacterium]
MQKSQVRMKKLVLTLLTVLVNTPSTHTISTGAAAALTFIPFFIVSGVIVYKNNKKRRERQRLRDTITKDKITMIQELKEFKKEKLQHKHELKSLEKQRKENSPEALQHKEKIEELSLEIENLQDKIEAIS